MANSKHTTVTWIFTLCTMGAGIGAALFFMDSRTEYGLALALTSVVFLILLIKHHFGRTRNLISRILNTQSEDDMMELVKSYITSKNDDPAKYVISSPKFKRIDIRAVRLFKVIFSRRIMRGESPGQKYVFRPDAGKDLPYRIPAGFDGAAVPNIVRPHTIQTHKCNVVRVPCTVCGGSGKCRYCHGSGFIICPRCSGKKKVSHTENGNTIYEPCSRCNGSGRLPCDHCDGTGSCISCEGSGSTLCPRCNGTGGYQTYEYYDDAFLGKKSTVYLSKLSMDILNNIEFTETGEVKEIYRKEFGQVPLKMFADMMPVLITAVDKMTHAENGLVKIGALSLAGSCFAIAFEKDRAPFSLLFNEKTILGLDQGHDF